MQASTRAGMGCGVVVLLAVSAAAEVPLMAYPGAAPGKAEAVVDGGVFTLRNELIRFTWAAKDGTLVLDEAVDVQRGARLDGHELFRIVLTDGGELTPATLELAGPPGVAALEGNPAARRGAERYGGWMITARFVSADGATTITYEAELRDQSNYVIVRFALRNKTDDLDIDAATLIDVQCEGAKPCGRTQGAPVAAEPFFLAYEHPMAEHAIEDGRVRCCLKRRRRLKAGEELVQTAAMGVVPAGQLRRGFLYYVERERAHPYRPFLHYNSWYDIAWGDRKFDEAQSLNAIRAFGEELVKERGAVMDSFVFDDGWDDNRTLWQFHDGFPNGFERLEACAAEYHSRVGAWLSPFGGYGEAKKQRLEFGREHGFETNEHGFSLSGPKYYARFKGICAEMMRDYGVNFFKFDGMGTGYSATTVGGGAYINDIEALMTLVEELRAIDPALYVSATTGTWCSPYFLWYADSTWRGEHDMGYLGDGTKRQQWITYRDTYTYRNVVALGPLYPLNSLMTQGIVQANFGLAAELGADLKEWGDEVWSFFGSGTGLQELYIAPGLLSDAQWDVLAAGAKWARAHAAAFRDVHWVGGDPGKGAVYGFAGWSKGNAVLTLRNPSPREKTITLDARAVFELPAAAAAEYVLTTPRADQEGPSQACFAAHEPRTFALRPFEVLVFDAAP